MGICWIGSPVIRQQGRVDVSRVCFHAGGQLATQVFDPDGRVAQFGQRFPGEAQFARRLPHDLPEPPGHRPHVGFGDVELSGGVFRHDVAGQEARLVSNRECVPVGFTLDLSANDIRREAVRRCDRARKLLDFSFQHQCKPTS